MTNRVMTKSIANDIVRPMAQRERLQVDASNELVRLLKIAGLSKGHSSLRYTVFAALVAEYPELKDAVQRELNRRAD